MKSKSFILSAIILALGGFFAKAIGAIYKIPLTNILGSGGMGLYYLVFPVYSLIITFCSSGVSVALSCEVAKCRRLRARYNEQKLLRVALVLSFVLSLFFTIVIIFISTPLSTAQGNVNASLSYIAIAPAIILSSIIATLRGYFQGVENMVPTTVSLIVEQVAKLSLGLILAHKLCNFGVQYAVLGAIVGVTFSEVVALIIIAINFFSFKGQLYYNYRNKTFRRFKKVVPPSILKAKVLLKNKAHKNLKHTVFCSVKNKFRLTTLGALRLLLKTLLPATFSSIIIPIATMLDSFMVINLLVSSGYSSAVSTSLYGLWGGVVQSLISLPTILIAGISTSLVPSLSGVIAGGVDGQVDKKLQFYIKVTWVLAVLMFMLLYVFASPILRFLYGNGLRNDVLDELSIATTMLKISSVSIIYYAFLQTFTAILQAMGKSFVPFLSLLLSLVLRTILLVVLTKNIHINIFGGVIANTLFLSLADIILAVYLKLKCGVRLNVFSLLSPLAVAVLCIVIMEFLQIGLLRFTQYLVAMAVSAVVGTIVFVVLMYFGRVFSEKEKNIVLKKKNTLGVRNFRSKR